MPWILILITVLMAAGAAGADDGETRPDAVVGYVDADHDGRNDRFRDADGDGVNDVTGKAYGHRFTVVDGDGDGRNDRFRDADGDGVNDLDGRRVDRDGDGVCDNVVDADGDGVNDITGHRIDAGREVLEGWRWGRVDEADGIEIEDFVDRDGDGMYDAWAGRGHSRPMDLFIDEDGDGIADGRWVRGRMVEPMHEAERDLRMPARDRDARHGEAGRRHHRGDRDRDRDGDRDRGDDDHGRGMGGHR